MENLSYFEQYKMIYHTAYSLHTHMEEFKHIFTDIGSKIQIAEKYIQNLTRTQKNSLMMKKNKNKPKRFRRTNEMIDRNYRCAYQKCDKAYASQGSLQQHIRLKHQDSPLQYHYSHKNNKKQSSEVRSSDQDYDQQSSESQEESVIEQIPPKIKKEEK